MLRNDEKTASSSAKIGPNSLTQTVGALREMYSETQVEGILYSSGQGYLLHNPPTTMVDEQEFDKLIKALVGQMTTLQAKQILQRSGELTAMYLLKNRIPGVFQFLLRLLPRRVALYLLCVAMSKHAWTFIGSGTFTFDFNHSMPILRITSNLSPMEVVCNYYGGTFQHLVHTLIDSHARLRHIVNHHHCEFVIQYV